MASFEKYSQGTFKRLQKVNYIQKNNGESKLFTYRETKITKIQMYQNNQI